MANKTLDERCRAAFVDMAKDVKELRGIVQYVRDINYKLGHILEELRADYYYALGMRQFYDAYEKHMGSDYDKKDEGEEAKYNG